MAVSREEPRGLVFDIQRFSLHDGHGIRTLVFMKGCPLRCAWCSNPESQSARPEIMFFEDRCLDCGRCLEACPEGEALREGWPLASGAGPLSARACRGCGRCVEVCYAEARQLVGRWMSVQAVLDVVLRDRVFYEESGGGVTVGGGEPTFQAGFVAELLKRCRESGLHTALETCGYAPWEKLARILEQVDQLLLDIKHMDGTRHLEMTGVDNGRILDNARLASRAMAARAAAARTGAAGGGGEMVVRVPLIPGFNDGAENLHRLGRFVRDELAGVRRVDLLPYHSTGESKSLRLGRGYAMGGAEPQSPEQVGAAREVLRSYGLDVQITG